MKSKKRIFELVIGEKYSAKGYAYIILGDSHLYDEVHVLTDVLNRVKAKITVTIIKCNGWQDSEEEPEETTFTRYKCLSCNKIYNRKITECPECSSNKIKEYLMNSLKIKLEKIGSLQAHQEEITSSKEYKEELQFIEFQKYLKKAEDVILMKGF